MIGTTRSYLENNRDKISKFLKGLPGRYCAHQTEHKDSFDIAKKKLRIGPEQERNLERSMELLPAKYYERLMCPSLCGVETVLGCIAKDNRKAKGADPKSFVDESLLREIEASGFVNTLYQR